MRLSENLPPRLVGLDEQWPKAPAALHEASEILREMYRLDKARKFMRRLTPEDRTQVGGRVGDLTAQHVLIHLLPPQFTLKLAASDLFLGKKESYPASVPNPYLTTHLCMPPV